MTLPLLRIDAVLHADDGVAEHRGDLDGARAAEVIDLPAIAGWKPARGAARCRRSAPRAPSRDTTGARIADGGGADGERGRRCERRRIGGGRRAAAAANGARATGRRGRAAAAPSGRAAARRTATARAGRAGLDAMMSAVRRRRGDAGRLVVFLVTGADRELDAGLADDDRVAGLELRLVDLLAVDEGALRRAEVDDAHVTGAVDLDDRVHAAHRLVIELEVRRGHLAELDDGQAQPFLADQLIAFEDAECEGNFCAGHGHSPCTELLRTRPGV